MRRLTFASFSMKIYGNPAGIICTDDPANTLDLSVSNAAVRGGTISFGIESWLSKNFTGLLERGFIG